MNAKGINIAKFRNAPETRPADVEAGFVCLTPKKFNKSKRLCRYVLALSPRRAVRRVLPGIPACIRATLLRTFSSEDLKS